MYQVIDIKTSMIIKTCATRKAARAKADKIDLAYGAVRYVVRFVE